MIPANQVPAPGGSAAGEAQHRWTDRESEAGVKRLPIVLALVCSIAGIPVADAKSFVATMPDGGRLAFTLPESWHTTTQAMGPAITVKLSPAESGDFLVLLTILPVAPDSTLSNPEELQAVVLHAGEQKLNTALQAAIELTEVRGDHAFGYFYHLTDRNPEKGPGDYREAHQGMLLLEEYAASFTILTHSEDSATVERAIEALRSATIEAGE